MKFKLQGSYLLFIVIGFSLLTIGCFSFIKEIDFVSSSIKTNGKIVSYQSNTSTGSHKQNFYRPVIEFTDQNNQVVTFTSGSNQNNRLGLNQTIDVLYSKNNSQDAQIDNMVSLWALPIGISLFGFIFFIVGGVILYKEISRKKIISGLLSAGIKRQAKFLRTERYSPYGQKHSKFYRIILQLNENNRDYTLFSDHISYDPANLIKSDLIDVYVDPMNHKNYYVDLSFLPENYSSKSETLLYQNNFSRPLTWVTVLWKIVNVLSFIYIGSLTYHNLKINGVNYGIYLNSIASLPAYPLVIFAFVSHYLIQKQDEKAAINVATIKNDIVQESTALLRQNPSKIYMKYFWNSVKVIVKNALIFFFLLVPIMLIFSLIQFLLTGNGNITATY